jgi:glycosyltransferase involved in cell wall biosynthesis
MAQAVKRLIAEPFLAERISRNARAKAEKWDWAQILPRWQSLLLGDQLSVSSGCCA